MQGSTDLPVRAEYWFTSDKGGFRRIGYSVTPEVLERVGQTVGQMVAGIEHGVFPNHPTAIEHQPLGSSAPTAIPTASVWSSCADGSNAKGATRRSVSSSTWRRRRQRIQN